MTRLLAILALLILAAIGVAWRWWPARRDPGRSSGRWEPEPPRTGYPMPPDDTDWLHAACDPRTVRR